ncbi:hypothetical protein D920_01665 [Enterococcus faecalis 13-SD-W-01]|nr:hypothetical protein D920_01665 [Enterococcus faecalis 13-SD-W-01]
MESSSFLVYFSNKNKQIKQRKHLGPKKKVKDVFFSETFL